MQRTLLAVAVIGLVCTTLLAQPGSAARVTVTADSFDRHQTVVTFALPASASNSVWDLVDPQNRRTPVQADGSGQGIFILDDLAAGQTRAYQLVPAQRNRRADPAQARREGSLLKLTIEGKAVLTYQAEPGELPRPSIKPIYLRGGFIHPLVTPGGILVTDSYATNHLHQHGIWSAWTKTDFDGRHPDFWNMADAKGTVEVVALDSFWSGLIHTGFRARLRQVDLTSGKPVPAIEEAWELKLYTIVSGGKPCWLFDLFIRQECASPLPLQLPTYHYGGLGYRGHEQWNGAANTLFTTSEGITNRVQANESRAQWCDVGGLVDGHRAGTTIMTHPGNFRFPQPIRTHPTEPFFCFAPSQLGDWAIKPGEPYVASYRFVVHDGPPDTAEIDRLWHDYATPPTVTVSAN